MPCPPSWDEDQPTSPAHEVPATLEGIAAGLVAMLQQGERNAIELAQLSDRMATVEKAIATRLGGMQKAIEHLADGVSTALERANVANQKTEGLGHHLALIQGGAVAAET